MSASFHLSQINLNFSRIGYWYKEFMKRTEISFKTQEQRILQLEEQLRNKEAGPGPSDEQLERVLRKILADTFSESPTGGPPETANGPQEQPFVQMAMYPTPVRLEPGLLFVDPESVPSREYVETMAMLQGNLRTFPNGNISPEEYAQHEDDTDASDGKSTPDSKRPRLSKSV